MSKSTCKISLKHGAVWISFGYTRDIQTDSRVLSITLSKRIYKRSLRPTQLRDWRFRFSNDVTWQIIAKPLLLEKRNLKLLVIPLPVTVYG